MGEGKLNKAFLHFFAIFDDFPKFLSNFSILIFEKSSNMAKLFQKMKKSLVKFAVNEFLHGIVGTQNPSFVYPFRQYSTFMH